LNDVKVGEEFRFMVNVDDGGEWLSAVAVQERFADLYTTVEEINTNVSENCEKVVVGCGEGYLNHEEWRLFRGMVNAMRRQRVCLQL
jgi:hypothetical protein